MRKRSGAPAFAGRTTSSAAAIAMLPVAEERKKILIVEPAVADQITGDAWNRYVFRSGRNPSQDAISDAVAIGKPGVHVATPAQDYAFGRYGVSAFKEALAKTGATLDDEHGAALFVVAQTYLQARLGALSASAADAGLLFVLAVYFTPPAPSGRCVPETRRRPDAPCRRIVGAPHRPEAGRERPEERRRKI
jgi:ABC-type branched-subunit amino acid transport system substrate-binding protein